MCRIKRKYKTYGTTPGGKIVYSGSQSPRRKDQLHNLNIDLLQGKEVMPPNMEDPSALPEERERAQKTLREENIEKNVEKRGRSGLPWEFTKGSTRLMVCEGRLNSSQLGMCLSRKSHK